MKINNNARPWDKIKTTEPDQKNDAVDAASDSKSDAGKQHPKLSDDEFGKIGLKHIAYARFDNSSQANQLQTVNIFAADGSALGHAASIDQAHGIILQNDLIPVAVH